MELSEAAEGVGILVNTKTTATPDAQQACDLDITGGISTPSLPVRTLQRDITENSTSAFKSLPHSLPVHCSAVSPVVLAVETAARLVMTIGAAPGCWADGAAGVTEAAASNHFITADTKAATEATAAVLVAEAGSTPVGEDVGVMEAGAAAEARSVAPPASGLGSPLPGALAPVPNAAAAASAAAASVAVTAAAAATATGAPVSPPAAISQPDSGAAVHAGICHSYIRGGGRRVTGPSGSGGSGGSNRTVDGDGDVAGCCKSGPELPRSSVSAPSPSPAPAPQSETQVRRRVVLLPLLASEQMSISLFTEEGRQPEGRWEDVAGVDAAAVLGLHGGVGDPAGTDVAPAAAAAEGVNAVHVYSDSNLNLGLNLESGNVDLDLPRDLGVRLGIGSCPGPNAQQRRHEATRTRMMCRARRGGGNDGLNALVVSPPLNAMRCNIVPSILSTPTTGVVSTAAAGAIGDNGMSEPLYGNCGAMGESGGVAGAAGGGDDRQRRRLFMWQQRRPAGAAVHVRRRGCQAGYQRAGCGGAAAVNELLQCDLPEALRPGSDDYGSQPPSELFREGASVGLFLKTMYPLPPSLPEGFSVVGPPLSTFDATWMNVVDGGSCDGGHHHGGGGAAAAADGGDGCLSTKPTRRALLSSAVGLPCRDSCTTPHDGVLPYQLQLPLRWQPPPPPMPRQHAVHVSIHAAGAAKKSASAAVAQPMAGRFNAAPGVARNLVQALWSAGNPSSGASTAAPAVMASDVVVDSLRFGHGGDDGDSRPVLSNPRPNTAQAGAAAAGGLSAAAVVQALRLPPPLDAISIGAAAEPSPPLRLTTAEAEPSPPPLVVSDVAVAAESGVDGGARRAADVIEAPPEAGRHSRSRDRPTAARLLLCCFRGF